MQLKIVVLPAPLGPIRPHTWPDSTPNDGPASAVTPPKRTCTSSTLRSIRLELLPPPPGVIPNLARCCSAVATSLKSVAAAYGSRKRHGPARRHVQGSAHEGPRARPGPDRLVLDEPRRRRVAE